LRGLLKGDPTRRWTRAAVAHPSSTLVLSWLTAGAPPRQLCVRQLSPCVKVMNRKLILICMAAGALLPMIGVALSLSGQTLSSTVSPNSKYKVEISQKRDAAGIERYVYLNAYRNGEQFVQSKLIYTGDTLDSDFRDLYPNYSWPSESILKLGRKVETQSNSLRITNESSKRISYLLIETYQDKYVLFDVAPQSIVKVKFQFLGQLSCQGEFVESKQRFGTAVRLSNDAENEVQGDFSIGIKKSNAIIESRTLKLKTVTCCAVDRPDIHHEQFYR
jgi:hypothetical protein